MPVSLQFLLSQWESDASLLEVYQLARRFKVLDKLDAYFPQADLPSTHSGSIEPELEVRARSIRSNLEAVNSQLYQSIRLEIQQEICPAAFLRLLRQSLLNPQPSRSIGYDHLDDLVGGVLQFDKPSEQTVHNGPEIVFYQPTPARHILTLITSAAISANDVFVDLGSGLGHAPLLVSVCIGARSIGIELEPSFVACARQCAQKLNLSRVSFLQEDARESDLSIGSIFYLYTPFTGSILRTVLNSLKKQAAARPIKICTFGPITTTIAKEPWLKSQMTPETDQITVFSSHP